MGDSGAGIANVQPLQRSTLHVSEPRSPPNAACMYFAITNHARESLVEMNELRRAGKLCDINLRAESDTYPAHRVVLASVSLYFKAMFCSGMLECAMVDIPLQNVKSSVLSMLIDFAYTSEIVVNELNVCALLPAATMFQMAHVVDACCTFLEHQLDATNCIGIADFASAHGCTTLYERARDYIYQNFREVSQADEFLNLSLAQLKQVIRRDELNVRCESEVYAAVLRWVRQDEDKRCSRLDQLLPAVRCHSLTPRFLRAQLSSCPTLRRAPSSIAHLSRVLDDLSLHRPVPDRGRVPALPRAAYVIGGYLRHSLANVDSWDPGTGKWSAMAELSTSRSGVAACQIAGRIYVVGGRNNVSALIGPMDSPRVDQLDPELNEWSRCADMSVARNRVGAAALDGMIYAVGGSAGQQNHSSVERYDVDKDEWTAVAPMSQARIGVGVAVVNRQLYAVGGFDGEERLASVECYDPDKDAWKFVAPMAGSRSGAGVCAVGQYVYAVGGYDGRDQLASVERYSVATDQWESLAPMLQPRSALSLAVINARLYAIGGYDGANFLASVERYDADAQTWTDVARMACGRSGHGVAVATAPNPDAIQRSNAPSATATGSWGSDAELTDLWNA